MKRICCVCKKYLGEKPGPKDMITHGYCESCLEIYMAEMEAEFKELDPCSAKATQGKPIIAKATQGKPRVAGVVQDKSCVAGVVQDMSCVAAGEAG